MHPFSFFSRLFLAACTLLLANCSLSVAPEVAQSTTAPLPATAEAAATHPGVTNVEVLGIITVPNDAVAFETLIGGLSAIAYDSDSDAYYFLSDDRAVTGPSRIYQAAIDLSDGTLDDGDLTWTGLIPLLDETGAPFAQGALDPEGMALVGDNFYISTEGDGDLQPPIAAAIIEFSAAGEFVATLPLPEKFTPTLDGSRGVRSNKGFESLTLTPDGRYLISGLEIALAQDGPVATLEEESYARLLTIDLAEGAVITEQLFVVGAIPLAPNPAGGDADNGLVDLVALDDQGTLLALERSYAEGVANTVRLFLTSTRGATDVSSVDALAEGDEMATIDAPMVKELLVDFGELGSELGIAPDNLEGMALGSVLPDGRRLLLAISDNNFNPSQTTQLWALALTLEES
jgi:hypothetical protein